MPLRLSLIVAFTLIGLLPALPAQAQRSSAAPAPVAACTDFYSHATAQWRHDHPLSADQESLSRWSQLDARAQGQLQTLIASADPAQGPASTRLAALYASMSDQARTRASGQRALKAAYQLISKLRRVNEVPALRARLQAMGYVMRPELDASFHVNPAPEITALAADYRALLATALTLTGQKPATTAADANAIWALESAMASNAPSTAPLAHWQAWLRARVALSLAPLLEPALQVPYETFTQQTLAGKPARSRAQWLTDELLTWAPDLLDAAYQERYLDAARRERVQHVAEALRAAQAKAIANARWLSAEGKAEALQRLSALRLEIGRTPSGPLPAWPSFQPDDAAKNLLALQASARPALTSASGEPIRQWQPLLAWLPATGQLVISSAALQPPLLAEQPGPGDFGSLGALIGQQLGHVFQTWNGADARAWQARSQGLIAQYSRYPITADLRVDGSQTFAQNQADLAGIELAWSALQANGGTDVASAQAFFTAWAGLWARQDRDPARAAANAVHAPARWRVNGPLLNFPAFAKTYGCKGRDAMLRPTKDQIALWR